MLRLEQYNVYMSIHDETTGAREGGGHSFNGVTIPPNSKDAFFKSNISGTTWTYSRII